MPKSGPCFIHVFERKQLGLDGEYTVKGHSFDNYLLLLDGEMEITPRGLSAGAGPDGSGFQAITADVHFNERRRRGQRIDKGGYYLDPQEII
jgi:hypothetical protein